MQNMVSFILLLTPLIVPSSTQTRTVTLEALAQRLEQLKSLSDAQYDVLETYLRQDILENSLTQVKSDTEDIEEQGRVHLEAFLKHSEDFTLQSADIKELIAVVGATQNATSQLLTELDTLKGRQAVSAAVQASQVFLFVVYLLTIITIYVVKRCQKVREESQRREFELLERKLLSNKARRRAAAAKEKSAPVPSQK